jgi:hypothetical protein
VTPEPDWFPLDLVDAVTIPPVVVRPAPFPVHRLAASDPARERESCEGCGSPLINYAYSIGGGYAYACQACYGRTAAEGGCYLAPPSTGPLYVRPAVLS